MALSTPTLLEPIAAKAYKDCMTSLGTAWVAREPALGMAASCEGRQADFSGVDRGLRIRATGTGR